MRLSVARAARPQHSSLEATLRPLASRRVMTVSPEKVADGDVGREQTPISYSWPGISHAWHVELAKADSLKGVQARPGMA